MKEKILELKELAEVLKTLKKKGKKVVHCHGCFDLLHIGHIKHLEAAKKLGGLLLVTVTPDRFVNKGPGRPVFDEQLRAEALAALDCVDFVAINKWPTAVRTIRLLRPDVYVKGSEYRNTASDVTGKIIDETAAVKKIRGRIAYTDDITFSSSGLINKHMSGLSQEAKKYLDNFTQRYSKADVLSYLENAMALKVLVVGEAIIDEYQYCTAIGKSSKEPTLVVKSLSNEKFTGGILAVANHVSSFCGKTSTVTALGRLNSQERFIRDHLSSRIDPVFLYRNDAPTIVKRRLIENYFFTKMMEVYEINDCDLTDADNKALCRILRKKVPAHDLVIVVDYGHGLLSHEAIGILCEKSRFLAVNAQANAGNLGYHTISMYPRADYITMTENEIRLEARDRRGDIREMVRTVADRLSCDRFAVTRGSNGCLCYRKKQGFVEVPAFAEKIVDRIGAGDAFLSISALCAVRNAPMEIVGFVGNIAGAEAVATVGNRQPIERISLMKHVETILK
jgi:rfaE bifunctional protein nucleotidyltransferase chain/domain